MRGKNKNDSNFKVVFLPKFPRENFKVINHMMSTKVKFCFEIKQTKLSIYNDQ